VAVTENVVVTAWSERLPTGAKPRNPRFLGDPSQLRHALLEEQARD
jgi:hypothetical protein